MARALLFGLLVASPLSYASGVRLFPQPSVLTLLKPDLALSEQQVTEPHVPSLIAGGAFAALLATPVALVAGAGLGTLSNNLYAALVPSLLTALLVPPLAVVLTEWFLAERSGKGRFRLVPTLLVALVAQGAILAAGIFLGANATSGSGVALLTLASAVVLPTVTTAMLKVTERPQGLTVPVLSGNF